MLLLEDWCSPRGCRLSWGSSVLVWCLFSFFPSFATRSQYTAQTGSELMIHIAQTGGKLVIHTAQTIEKLTILCLSLAHVRLTGVHYSSHKSDLWLWIPPLSSSAQLTGMCWTFKSSPWVHWRTACPRIPLKNSSLQTQNCCWLKNSKWNFLIAQTAANGSTGHLDSKQPHLSLVSIVPLENQSWKRRKRQFSLDEISDKCVLENSG